MEIRVIGIDLGKSVFHLVGMDAYGKVVARALVQIGMSGRLE